MDKNTELKLKTQKLKLKLNLKAKSKSKSNNNDNFRLLDIDPDEESSETEKSEAGPSAEDAWAQLCPQPYFPRPDPSRNLTFHGFKHRQNAIKAGMPPGLLRMEPLEVSDEEDGDDVVVEGTSGEGEKGEK